MKILLMVSSIVAAPLLAIDTPAAAAPPEHQFHSECIDLGLITYCSNIDQTIKQTHTPSGNTILHVSYSNSYTVTFNDGTTPGFTDSYTNTDNVVFANGETRVIRYQDTHTHLEGGRSCTDITTYKVTNGMVQVESFVPGCTF